jgi:hypothetical protein
LYFVRDKRKLSVSLCVFVRRFTFDFSSFVMEIESVVTNKTLLAWRFQLPEHHFGFQIQILTSCLFFHRLRRLNNGRLIILLL